MTAQRTSLPALVTPDRVAGGDIQARFDAFHSSNAWVLTELERLAQQMIDAGRTRLSIETLIGKIRWDYSIATTGDVFRINDNFSSRYVRLLIERNPSWGSVFATRRLRTAA